MPLLIIYLTIPLLTALLMGYQKFRFDYVDHSLKVLLVISFIPVINFFALMFSCTAWTESLGLFDKIKSMPKFKRKEWFYNHLQEST